MTPLEALDFDPAQPVVISVPGDLTPEDPPAIWTIAHAGQQGQGRPSLPVMARMLLGTRIHVDSVDAWTRAQLHIGIQAQLPSWSADMVPFEANSGRQSLERAVARLMAIQSYCGYQLGDERVRPIWKTLTPSGRIVSEKPSLSNWPKAQRRAFVAEPGFRWYYLGWEYPELWLLAQKTESPYLRRLAGHPEIPLAELWGCGPGRVQQTFYEVMRWGPTAAIPDGGWPTIPRAVLVQAAPEWAVWWVPFIGVRTIELPIFRATIEAEPDRAHGAYLRGTVALVLKVLLMRMANWAELHLPVWDGLRTLIPLYEGVYYQAPSKIPAATHADAAHRVAAETWRQSLGGEPPASVVLAGGSWGELYPVTGVLDTLDADLRDPHPNARYE